MAVLHPLRLVIDNWPTDEAGAPVVEHFDVANNPENPADGTRQVAFSGELWIESEDFAEVPPPKFFRLTVGREVRLRGAYLVTATGIEKDGAGEVVAVHATYDPATRGGDAPDGRKVKSTMHWVSALHATDITVGLYGRLFTTQVPGEATGEALDDLNPDSREMVTGKAEAAIADAAPDRSCSSSGSATSRPIRTPRPSSTARWACATSGLPSRSARAEQMTATAADGRRPVVAADAAEPDRPPRRRHRCQQRDRPRNGTGPCGSRRQRCAGRP